MTVELNNNNWKNGTVKWFSFRRGYGFVAVSGHSDVFIHASILDEAGFVTCREDDKIRLRIGKSDLGYEAIEAAPLPSV